MDEAGLSPNARADAGEEIARRLYEERRSCAPCSSRQAFCARAFLAVGRRDWSRRAPRLDSPAGAGHLLGGALAVCRAVRRRRARSACRWRRSAMMRHSASRSTIIQGWFSDTARAGSVLAGGGRYDRLLALLGAQKPIPASAFRCRIDRIEELRAA